MQNLSSNIKMNNNIFNTNMNHVYMPNYGMNTMNAINNNFNINYSNYNNINQNNNFIQNNNINIINQNNKIVENNNINNINQNMNNNQNQPSTTINQTNNTGFNMDYFKENMQKQKKNVESTYNFSNKKVDPFSSLLSFGK